MTTVKNFIKNTNLNDKTEFDKVSYIAFFLSKASNDGFTIEQVNELLNNNGIYISNISRIKKRIKVSKNFKNIRDNVYTLTNKGLSELNELNDYIECEEISECETELLNESIFCGYVTYITKIVHQVNKCYEEKCYDACATMIRRLLEILLINSYEKLNISQSIKDSDGNYFQLEKICKDAKTNKILNLSRIRNKLDQIRNIGNYAAHRITYNTTRADIDEIKIDLRVLLEELLYKSGIKK